MADLAAKGDPLKQAVSGLFFQDDWLFTSGWTANLGLRVDRASIAAEDGQNLYRQTLLGPRLGLTWDPSEAGKMRVFAYAGRIFSPPVPGTLAASSPTRGVATERQVWIPSLTDWRTWQKPRSHAVGNLKAPRTDLYQVGLERIQVLPWIGEWTLSATLTIKAVRDLVDTYDVAYGYLPDLHNLVTPSTSTKVIANLPGLKRDFRGMDVVAQRLFEGGHRIQVSYSQGDLNGNSEVGNVSSSTGRNTGFASIPSLRQDFRLPQYDGNLNEEIKHAWKVFGSAALPWNLETSFAFQRRSGHRYSRLVRVSGDNVLASGAVRGDQELPPVTSLDAGLAWRGRVERVDLRAAVDVFNLTNHQPMIWVNNVGAAFTPGNFQQPRVWQFSLRAGF